MLGTRDNTAYTAIGPSAGCSRCRSCGRIGGRCDVQAHQQPTQEVCGAVAQSPVGCGCAQCRPVSMSPTVSTEGRFITAPHIIILRNAKRASPGAKSVLTLSTRPSRIGRSALVGDSSRLLPTCYATSKPAPSTLAGLGSRGKNSRERTARTLPVPGSDLIILPEFATNVNRMSD